MGFDSTAPMRLKKGSKVEVLSKREVPSGSWWCAEIISGNGHTYSVKYDCYLPDMDGAVERVPRKAIRPCPPPVKCPRRWSPGDIVEVFEHNSWKLGEVSGGVGGNYFFVRLLGSSRQFRVHLSDIRLRQSWHDNKWVVIQKNSGRYNDAPANRQTKTRKFSTQLLQSRIVLERYGGDGHAHADKSKRSKEPTPRSMKKRPHFCLSPNDTCTGGRKKMRAVEKVGWCEGVTAGHPSQLPEKAHAVASPCKVLGEKRMHAFLNNKVCETSMNNQKPHAGVGYHFIEGIDPNDAESVSSSIGSFSPSYSPYGSFPYPVTRPTHDLDGNHDDAESPCASGRELTLHTEEALEAEIHRLELHSYRSTLLALRASGPLSWEKEALITNLRLMLRISNDEHISELRHLASAKTSNLQSSSDTV